MNIPETPTSIDELDLIQRLNAYADGTASWLPDGAKPGPNAVKACQTLRTDLTRLVDKMLGPLLSRINAREMETFTMHDSTHSLKVAHLIWHILHPDRRNTLTPPEIAILVASAFLHDLGMALSPQERERRLYPDSDLWSLLEIDESLKDSIQQLKARLSADLPKPQKDRARHRLAQAEEALLCRDTRERHTSPERYKELLDQLQQFHIEDPTNLPDIESCLSFEGDSFRDKLIDICVSHGRDIDFLLEKDQTNIERDRFPHDYTIGSCTADLHMIAAALRLADILDFDRERTPPILYHYLLPTALAPQDDRSLLEWAKHLAISNWNIDKDAVVFKGRCTSHIIHHAIVHFCFDIQNEIKSSLDTFAVRNRPAPFELPTAVQPDIDQRGYTYVPYRFELDDSRVYELLMGGAIYDNPLVAVRELVQNAVDACKLRDALTLLYRPNANPATTDRITITYREPTATSPHPTLTVTDIGTGMDRWILENYFLKVGKSYYNSSDFNQTRLKLRTKNEALDFAPVSEFGIGFLSSFLLAERLEVETAMWESLRGDTVKRNLIIDGPTRLIRLSQQENQGLGRFEGTAVTLHLSRGSEEDKNAPPPWNEFAEYLKKTCQDLPYRLHLEHIAADGVTHTDYLDPLPLKASILPELEEFAYRIPVNDAEFGLEGEIAFINGWKLRQSFPAQDIGATLIERKNPLDYTNVILRAGFNIGPPPGLPSGPRLFGYDDDPCARIRLTWQSRKAKRYATPNLARNGPANNKELGVHIVRSWLTHMLDNLDTIPEGLLQSCFIPSDLLSFSSLAFLEDYDAYTIYRLAKSAWRLDLGSSDSMQASLADWESAQGPSIPYSRGFPYITYNLLDFVLPRITRLQFDISTDPLRFLVAPPSPGWKQTLKNCRDFITKPIPWPIFVEFTGPQKDILFLDTINSFSECLLNSHFKEQITPHFQTAEELQNLLSALKAFTNSRVFSTPPSPAAARVFKKAQDAFGHLQIGIEKETWRIDSFDIPDIPET